MFDYTLIIQYIPLLISGIKNTIIISICSCFIGFLLGSFFAVLSHYGGKISKFLIEAYVIIIRGTPMLIQILASYYILPLIGINISGMATAIIAIGLNSSAYVSQTIKSGINAVELAQIEAAYTLGLSKLQTIQYIVFPQAIRVIFPSLSNELVTLIKDSSLASVIGVAELTKEGRIIGSQTYDIISVYIMLAIIYLCLTSSVSFFMHIIERKFLSR